MKGCEGQPQACQDGQSTSCQERHTIPELQSIAAMFGALNLWIKKIINYYYCEPCTQSILEITTANLPFHFVNSVRLLGTLENVSGTAMQSSLLSHSVIYNTTITIFM